MTIFFAIVASVIVVSLFVFVVLREVILWCFKINHMLAELEKTNVNLGEIIKRLPPPPTAEIEEPPPATNVADMLPKPPHKKKWW